MNQQKGQYFLFLAKYTHVLLLSTLSLAAEHSRRLLLLLPTEQSPGGCLGACGWMDNSPPVPGTGEYLSPQGSQGLDATY